MAWSQAQQAPSPLPPLPPHTGTHIAVIHARLFMRQPGVLREESVLAMHRQEMLRLDVAQELLQFLLIGVACSTHTQIYTQPGVVVMVTLQGLT